MAHGEAEHGCAQGEPSRPGHDPQAAGKHRRPVSGAPAHPVEPPAGRAEDEIVLPRQRSAEPSALSEPDTDVPAGCLSELPGWAGAHRHGPVRPRPRATRRERPPRRWC
ncbi:hypothetical protein [Micromonospora parathelypteridis]|uniref:Uncharacterized protein n=1 Tax=Micromonospora parathelypteridis TaxID=1839617 RepID=A0A840VJJ1_9ACTN|nr:hypothetical protein [Micromonospora parathelypteridis]MBB5476825.1 hypothetical protein [Micromonospora parathelypteridis]GGO17213.1 hypothetical protein GCM10011576_30860 [Micromonospora parathelypteridis]